MAAKSKEWKTTKLSHPMTQGKFRHVLTVPLGIDHFTSWLTIFLDARLSIRLGVQCNVEKKEAYPIPLFRRVDRASYDKGWYNPLYDPRDDFIFFATYCTCILGEVYQHNIIAATSIIPIHAAASAFFISRISQAFFIITSIVDKHTMFIWYIDISFYLKKKTIWSFMVQYYRISKFIISISYQSYSRFIHFN